MVQSLIYMVIYLIIVGVIMWLLRYLIDAIPMDEPFRRVANVAIVVVGVLVVILLLLSFIGVIDGGVRPIR